MTTVFEEFLRDVESVLTTADSILNVLRTKIPTEFYEPQPSLIGKSFLKFISNKDDFSFSSVQERLESNHYTSLYTLYHDIRLSAVILLHQLEIGSEKYIEIDRFYKFATEFIMREAFRLNIKANEVTKPHNKKHGSDFETLLSEDFVKISTSYTLGNQEAYYVTTQNNTPLFTSFNQRSALDEREIQPSDKFDLTKILPHTHVPNQNMLSSVSPVSNRIAQLSDQQQSQQILSNFLHPNWYSLPTAKWLEQSDLQSFAPMIDEQNTVVPSAAKARLWLEHIGLKQLIGSIESTAPVTEVSPALNGHKEDAVMDDTQDQTIALESQPSQEPEGKPQIPIGKISLENLYEWAPGNEISEDEIEAFENGTEAQLVNELLRRLHQMREGRVLKGLLKPNYEETLIYHKVHRVLTEIINAGALLPDVNPSALLPILQTEYTGTLPVPTQGFVKKKNKSMRR